MARYKTTIYDWQGETHAIYDTSNDARVCACGCGSQLPIKARKDKLYLNNNHRMRHQRRKTTHSHKCHCGCGVEIVGNNAKLYASNACRQRAFRARKTQENMPL